MVNHMIQMSALRKLFDEESDVTHILRYLCSKIWVPAKEHARRTGFDAAV
jgi:hypothetical protein